MPSDGSVTSSGAAGGVRVAIVDLGRAQALGAVRRVESWRHLWTHCGAMVDVIALSERCPPKAGESIRLLAAAAGRSRAVPEAAAWSPSNLRKILRSASPDVVILVTARAFHPSLIGIGGITVLDYVDRLSVSYGQRAGLVSPGPVRLLYSMLGWRMAAFERGRVPGVVATAAGFDDARRLGADWVPNIVEPVVPRATHPGAADVLFVGTLSYPPNDDAVRRLLRIWPAVLDRRPQSTALVAGARPSRSLSAAISRAGWRLEEDFESIDEVCAGARIAVAPVAQATGIQNKVLETAARGLAQIVHPSVLAGTGYGFPAERAHSDDALVRAIVDLADDDERRLKLGEAARRYVAREFSADRWAPWCERTAGSIADRRPRT